MTGREESKKRTEEQREKDLQDFCLLIFEKQELIPKMFDENKFAKGFAGYRAFFRKLLVENLFLDINGKCLFKSLDEVEKLNFAKISKEYLDHQRSAAKTQKDVRDNLGTKPSIQYKRSLSSMNSEKIALICSMYYEPILRSLEKNKKYQLSMFDIIEALTACNNYYTRKAIDDFDSGGVLIPDKDKEYEDIFDEYRDIGIKRSNHQSLTYDIDKIKNEVNKSLEILRERVLAKNA